jgi:hypothetical protein
MEDIGVVVGAARKEEIEKIGSRNDVSGRNYFLFSQDPAKSQKICQPTQAIEQ